MQLQQIQDSAHGRTEQLNLEGTISVGKNYHIGSHASTFEAGFYIRNAHKFDDSYEIDYCPTNATTAPLASQFLNGFHNSNYYNGHYPYGPGISWEKINADESAWGTRHRYTLFASLPDNHDMESNASQQIGG